MNEKKHAKEIRIETSCSQARHEHFNVVTMELFYLLKCQKAWAKSALYSMSSSSCGMCARCKTTGNTLQWNLFNHTHAWQRQRVNEHKKHKQSLTISCHHIHKDCNKIGKFQFSIGHWFGPIALSLCSRRSELILILITISRLRVKKN